MKNFKIRLLAGLLALIMVLNVYVPVLAAPVNAADSLGEIVLSEEVETTLNAAKALASLNDTYGAESDDNTITIEESNPMILMAEEELKENATVYNLTEEQSQELLGMYSQYLQLYEANADIFGVQVPYNTTRDTNASPIGSLLDVAGIPEQYAQAGYIGYDVLSGIIQLYLLGTQFAVSEYADEIRAARDEALDAIKDATTDMQEYLLLNAWLADNCQFNMAYIMEQMVEPEPAENELYTYAYNCMYKMIYDQVYDGTYNAVVDYYGEEQAKAIATSQADSYMVDVQEDGGSGEQQAASTAASIVGMWGSNQVGVFVQKKAVCFGYATVYAYLLQCAHPEIYLKKGATNLNDAANWKSYTELNYELDSSGKPVKDADGNYKWSKDCAAITDFVKIIFDAEPTMFGQQAPFGEAHYWNAVKLDGKWYYVDPCYIDIYVECMNRDRVETDGNMNHLYFMFSDDSCREMYDGNFEEIRTLYEGIATDQTYEDAWSAFIKSQPYKVDDRTYYFYDSTDLLDIMREYGNGGSSSNSRAANDYEGLFTDSEYKIVYHTDAMGDKSSDFETLIDFNNGQVYNPSKGAMEDNELIAELYEEHQEYVQEYPSIMISCAYYNNMIYFSLSNCVLSYNLNSGAVTKLIEYTEVTGERDMTNGLGGLAFTMVNSSSDKNSITVTNPPIADMTISGDEMIVSVATNYAFISGKDFGDLTDYSSYGYKFAETNYNPAYNSYYNSDEDNDNDEFMWSANIVGTIEMSHLTGKSHDYSNVNVPASCTEDAYTVNRCSKCGLINETTTAQAGVQTLDAEEVTPEEGAAKLPISITVNPDGTKVDGVIEVKQEDQGENAGTSYSFTGEFIKTEAQKLLKDATIDESCLPTEAIEVEYGKVGETVNLTATKNVAATLNITVKAGEGEKAITVGSTILTSKTKGVAGDKYTFPATTIQNEVEGLKLTEGYVLAADNKYEDVIVAYGDTKDESYAANEVKAATLNITVKAGDVTVGSKTITSETTGVVGTEYTFQAKTIQETVEGLTLTEGYELAADNKYENVTVNYGSSEDRSYAATAKEAENVAATLNITVKAGDVTVGSKTITSETTGVAGTEYTFQAKTIQETVEGLTLTEGYELAANNKYEDVTVNYGSSEDRSYAANEVKLATLNITVKAGDVTVGSKTITSETTGVVGTEYTFQAKTIQDTVEGLTLTEGYELAKNTYEDVKVAYGSTGEVSYTATAKEEVEASLIVRVYKTATVPEDEDEAATGLLVEVTVTTKGYVGETKEYTAEEITNLVKEKVEAKGYKLDTVESGATVTYGEDDVVVKLTATSGEGHTYVKFEETYYTKSNNNWKSGTSYVCIDCGHAFELEDGETVEDHLRSNDTVLTDSQMNSYKSNQTEVWTWSTDGTEASLYMVPTELKDHMFDCVWENPALSSREVATVKGDCETGKFTATLSSGKTSTKTVTAGKHSYLNQEEKDDNGNVTQEAAVQWSWADDCSSATVTFLCDVCHAEESVTVKKGDSNMAEGSEVAPTCTEDGYITYTATVTVDDVNYISSRNLVTQKATGHHYENGVCTECGAERVNPFVDISESDYYYDAILWAYEEGITTGTDETHFAPADNCTRGQVVTFLWRAMGKPAPKGTQNPFVDISESDYYYDAILWAYEEGITTGVDATHFAPNDTVTRGQFVTFLHRNEGEPAPKGTSNPFVDVSKDTYYYDAIIWAYENGITTGTDETHFAPEDTCIRGQVVTFLYRAYGEE